MTTLIRVVVGILVIAQDSCTSCISSASRRTRSSRSPWAGRGCGVARDARRVLECPAGRRNRPRRRTDRPRADPARVDRNAPRLSGGARKRDAGRSWPAAPRRFRESGSLRAARSGAASHPGHPVRCRRVRVRAGGRGERRTGARRWPGPLGRTPERRSGRSGPLRSGAGSLSRSRIHVSTRTGVPTTIRGSVRYPRSESHPVSGSDGAWARGRASSATAWHRGFVALSD